jgi:hypothetical protein
VTEVELPTDAADPQPEWMGPPKARLGGVVPVRVVLARTTQRIITLSEPLSS